MKSICKNISKGTLFILILFTLIACERETAYVDSYVIEKGGVYGLIDSTGNEIVEPRFLSIEPIQKDGIALAIIDTIYTSVRDSSFLGIRNIPVLNIKYGYITAEDKFLFPEPSYAKITIEGYMDSIRAFSRFCQETSFYGGLAVAQDTTTLLYGYIGLNGDTIIPAQYRSASRFNEGRAAVQLDYKEGMNGSGRWGLINPEGNNVCDFVYNQIETPVNKRAIASITTVNKQEGGAIEGEISVDENGKAYVDKSKATVIEASDSPTFSTTIFLVDENGKIINENMNMMYQYSNFSKDGIAVAIPNRIAELLGAGFRFISKNGEFIEGPDVNDITEEQAKKIVESKYFLGELLPTDIEFADATRFTEGYAAVNLGKAWTFIDKQLIPRGNDENPIYENALPFSHGLAGIKLNNKYGYINTEFNVVVPCKYDSCAIAGKNLCRVYGGRKTENGYSIISYIDRSSKVIWQNVNYEGNYLKKEVGKTKHDWQEFRYTYIGKNYFPLFIIISIVVIIAIILIISKRHKKKSALNKEKTNAKNNTIDTNKKMEGTSDASLSEQKVTDDDSLLLKKDVIQNGLNESSSVGAPSVDERLNDILNL